MSSRITLVIADDDEADRIVTLLQGGHQAIVWPAYVVTVSLEPASTDYAGPDGGHRVVGHVWGPDHG